MILATTQVKDLDQFLAVFGTAGADKRRLPRVEGATVSHPMEENRVWVLRLGQRGLDGVRHRRRPPASCSRPDTSGSPRSASVGTYKA